MARKQETTVVSENALLAMQGVKRWYGDGEGRVEVLRGVDLEIPAGKSVAIVGPSGSGKSTLLHVAGLLDRPDAGRVAVDGAVINAGANGMKDDALAKVRNETCGFVYQFHHLLREFTALENVMMPALIGGQVVRGLGGLARERAEELLDAVGLKKRAGHYPSQLSGGEQQRVAIARALMNKPKLLLADEPTGNLDPHTAEEVIALLFGLIKDAGMSALIVTHNMELAKRCDVTLRMDDGHLLKV